MVVKVQLPPKKVKKFTISKKAANAAKKD